MVFTNGCNKIYGNLEGRVDLKLLRDEDIVILNKYFNSFGIELNIRYYLETEYKMLNIPTYNDILIDDNTALKDLYFSLKSENMIYVINFSLI